MFRTEFKIILNEYGVGRGQNLSSVYDESEINFPTVSQQDRETLDREQKNSGTNIIRIVFSQF